MAGRATVLRGGGVYDGQRHLPGHGAVVVDGLVVAVAPDADLDVPAGAEQVDLAGGLLLPGFQDAHVHPVQGGLERIRCDLSGLSTREEYLAAVARYAAEHPEREWVLGGGWSMTAFGPAGPTAADLDAVVPDRPVFLPNRDRHGAWVSSRALELAGVDRHTPDPADGRLDRGPDGTPTGSLHEGAMSLVERLLPVTGDEELLEALLVAQAHLHSFGITAWQDAILGDYAGLRDVTPTYLRAAASGELTARVRGALWWDRERGLEQVEELVKRRRSTSAHPRFVPGTVKVMQDGVAENGTAAMSAPYLDRCGGPTHNHGLSFVDPLVLREAVVRLDAAGFQVHVHAIGDRAVGEALDAFAQARIVNGAADLRHHIAHVQVIHPDDRPRFADLAVAANMQPLWAAFDEQMTELTLPFLGPERSRWQYPFSDLARAGARLVAGSDWPVSSPDPLQGIHVAVNRWVHGASGVEGSEAFLPEQALSTAEAFAAYTSGSAHVNHLDRTGRVAPGMLADLAVLDRDPFRGPPEEIGAARVVATYVDGERVFG